MRSQLLPCMSPLLAQSGRSAAPVNARFRSKSGHKGFSSASRDSDFQWKVVNDLVPVIGNDERVPQENAEKTIGCDRVGFSHDHHTGPQYLLEFFGGDVLRDDMRLVGDQIDAVALGRARLIALVPEEFAGGTHGFYRLSRRDLGNDASIARKRDFIPEVFHHFCGLAYANG